MVQFSKVLLAIHKVDTKCNKLWTRFRSLSQMGQSFLFIFYFLFFIYYNREFVKIDNFY